MGNIPPFSGPPGTLTNIRGLAEGLRSAGRTVVSSNPGRTPVQNTAPTLDGCSRIECISPYALNDIELFYENYQNIVPSSPTLGESFMFHPLPIFAFVEVPLTSSVALQANTNFQTMYPVTFNGKTMRWIDPGCYALGECEISIPANKRFYIWTYWRLSAITWPPIAFQTITTPSTGGFISNTTAGVLYTYVYPDGTESLGSPATYVTLSGGTSTQAIVVSGPSNPGNGAIGWKLYTTGVGVSSGNVNTQFYESTLPNYAIINAWGASITCKSLFPSTANEGVSIKCTTDGTISGPRLPQNATTGGGTTAGTGNNGEGTGTTNNSSWASSTGVSILSQYYNTYAPSAVTATTKGKAPISVGIIGDSISNVVGDAGFLLTGRGGFIERACLNQYSALQYNPNIVPICGFVPTGRASESLSSFISLNNKLRWKKLKRTNNIICNHCVNDSPLGSAAYANNQYLLSQMTNAMGLPLWQTTSTPQAASSDGWKTLANQSYPSNSLTYQYQRAMDSFIRNAGGALTITGETPYSVFAGTVTPSTNLAPGGDGTTTNFITQYAFLEGSEVVRVNGVIKAVTTDYTYLLPSAVAALGTYASGILFNSAPANGVTVTIDYASVPGYMALTGAKGWFECGGLIRINGSGSADINGIWWKLPVAGVVTTGTAGAAPGANTYKISAAAQDTYRGYIIRIVTDSGTPSAVGAVNSILSQDSSGNCTLAGNWSVTPSSSSTYEIYDGFTNGGNVHPSSFGHMTMGSGINLSLLTV